MLKYRVITYTDFVHSRSLAEEEVAAVHWAPSWAWCVLIANISVSSLTCLISRPINSCRVNVETQRYYAFVLNYLGKQIV